MSYTNYIFNLTLCICFKAQETAVNAELASAFKKLIEKVCFKDPRQSTFSTFNHLVLATDRVVLLLPGWRSTIRENARCFGI